MTKKWNSDNVNLALSEIKIASPCNVPLSEMEDRGNCFYCNSCKLNVYHFSNLTNAEIADLLNGNNEKLCIGIFRREDGTMITKDCPLGLRDVGFIYRKSGLIKAIAFLMIIALIAAGFSGISFNNLSSSKTRTIFGKMSPVSSRIETDDSN